MGHVHHFTRFEAPRTEIHLVERRQIQMIAPVQGCQEDGQQYFREGSTDLCRAGGRQENAARQIADLLQEGGRMGVSGL